MAFYTVTLTDAATAYRVLDLVRAFSSDFHDSPGELTVGGHKDNTDIILIGETPDLSANKYSYPLSSSESRAYRRASLGRMRALSATAGQKLTIEVKR